MLIRRVNPADAEALAALHIACWRDAYAGIFPAEFLASLSVDDRIPIWRRGLDDPTRLNFIGEEDCTPIGFASCGPSRDNDAQPDTGELYGIYLLRPWWNTGRGHQLWLTAHAALTAARFSRITLWVFEHNTRARRFYERCGFTLEPGITKCINREGVRLPEVRYQMMIDERS